MAEQVGFSTIELEKLKYGLHACIAGNALIDSVSVERFCDMITVDVRGFVWSQKVDVIRYPADWWQAMKERWLPKWAKSRWPVRYTVYDVRVIYPNFNPPVPRQEYRWKIIKSS